MYAHAADEEWQKWFAAEVQAASERWVRARRFLGKCDRNWCQSFTGHATSIFCIVWGHGHALGRTHVDLKPARTRWAQLTPDDLTDEELDDLTEFLREEYENSGGDVPVETFEARLELRVVGSDCGAKQIVVSGLE